MILNPSLKFYVHTWVLLPEQYYYSYYQHTKSLSCFSTLNMLIVSKLLQKMKYSTSKGVGLGAKTWPDFNTTKNCSMYVQTDRKYNHEPPIKNRRGTACLSEQGEILGNHLGQVIDLIKACKWAKKQMFIST